jgi:hypothetical protein
MLSVLLLFLLPVGGGIPAGVLMARSQGLAWPVTAGLYLVSDVLLALCLNSYFRNPEATVLVVLGAMIAVPLLVRCLCGAGSSFGAASRRGGD